MLEAWRSPLPWLLLAAVGCALAAAGFSASLALTEGARFRAALLGGGVLAAPLGAWVAKHVPPRTAIIAVGLVVTGLSVHGLIRWAMA